MRRRGEAGGDMLQEGGYRWRGGGRGCEEAVKRRGRGATPGGAQRNSEAWCGTLLRGDPIAVSGVGGRVSCTPTYPLPTAWFRWVGTTCFLVLFAWPAGSVARQVPSKNALGRRARF